MANMIVIVGVGALGSHLVQFIRNEQVDIRIIDFDRVEQKNVMSQFHGKPGVGKSKVAALEGQEEGRLLDLSNRCRCHLNRLTKLSALAKVSVARPPTESPHKQRVRLPTDLREEI